MEKNKKCKLIKKVVSNFNHKISPKQLGKGIDVEHEHDGGVSQSTNIAKGNKNKVAKIAVAHLKEIPDYYTRLDRMEKEAKKKN